MPITNDPTDQRRQRRSIRLQGYNYSRAGAYYITICTRDRQCLLGKVVDGKTQLNEAGNIVQTVWEGLPQFYGGVELDAFIVMPNHIHGIIVIRTGVGAIHESPLQSNPPTLARVADRRRMLLSKVIGRFKMASAKRVNDLRQTTGSAVWQRNYYEHVVRDEESLNRIRQYIIDNPAQWDFDRENPAVGAIHESPLR
jgi:REP element-mobilizing transposase RayT